MYIGIKVVSNVSILKKYLNLIIIYRQDNQWEMDKHCHDLKFDCNSKFPAATFYQRLHFKMQGHPNQLIPQLHSSKSLPGIPTRRLNRNWPRDLLKN